MTIPGFRLKEEFLKSMFHWSRIEEGLVFNYRKHNFNLIYHKRKNKED